METEKVIYPKLVQARLSETQKDKFKHIAEKKGIKQAEFLRQTITDIIKEYEKKNGTINTLQTYIS